MKRKLPPNATANFRALLETYEETPIEFPKLKGVTLAHFAIQSAWGKTSLAARYLNYASLKWVPTITQPGASPILYDKERYAAFTNHGCFLGCYWDQFEAKAAYANWRAYTGSARDFMTYITPIVHSGRAPWTTDEPPKGYLTADERRYLRDVLQVHNNWFADFT